MRIIFYNAKPYDRKSFNTVNESKSFGHDIHYLECHLDEHTATLSEGHEVVCAFVNDILNEATLKTLSKNGIKLIALRSAGYNHVDLAVAKKLDLCVVRVPAYSPYAVAEHTIALLLALNRKIHRAYNRVREGNFALEGLLGFDLHGRTVGVIGTGKIGAIVTRILSGFGCNILAYDPFPNPECLAWGTKFVEMNELLSQSDVITLHCPLTAKSHHLIDADAIKRMRDGVTLINTSRGALIDTQAAIQGLKSGKIAYLGLDVYEEEGDLFFEDLSNQVIHDDVFARLMTFPNVIVTGHQAFFTKEALLNIATTTLQNISEYEKTGTCINSL